MKLRTPPTGAPRRTPCGAAGSALGSSLRSLSRLAGDSVSPVMSFACAERSRTTPCASTRPGFSAPGAPNRTSFMGLPLLGASASPCSAGGALSGRLDRRESRGPIGGPDALRPQSKHLAHGLDGRREASPETAHSTCAQVGDECAATTLLAVQTKVYRCGSKFRRSAILY